MPKLEQLPVTFIADTEVWAITYYGYEYWFHLYLDPDWDEYELDCFNPRNGFEDGVTLEDDEDIFDAIDVLLKNCAATEERTQRLVTTLTKEELSFFLEAKKRLKEDTAIARGTIVISGVSLGSFKKAEEAFKQLGVAMGQVRCENSELVSTARLIDHD